MSESLTVLFADSHVLVVNKPPRLLTASDDTGDETLLMQARAWHSARQQPGKKGYIAPLHFLDRPVSGVVMFALSSKAASRLAEAFRKRTIDKLYWAVVHGCKSPLGAEVRLEDWLLKDREANHVTVEAPNTEGAKASSLRYRLRQIHPTQPELCLLEIQLETGRSHQIRVQLASRGMPIYGDKKYGADFGFEGQIGLHARRVRFTHPVSKEMITVTAPLPETWRQVWPGGLHVQET